MKETWRTEIILTDEGIHVLDQAPPPLQETFAREFSGLKDWEQMMILSSLNRIVDMMEAKVIDASPILAPGPIIGTARDG